MQKKSGVTLVLPALLLLIFLGGGYFLFFSDSAQKLRPDTSVAQTEEHAGSTTPGTPAPEIVPVIEETAPDTPVMPDSGSIDTRVNSTAPGDSNTSETDLIPASSVSTDPLDQPPLLSIEQQQCQNLGDSIDSFFATLDTRDYMQAFQIGEKSAVYFPRLIQKLVDNPPIVSGETDDLFTILQNTAHFFRIIGKDNIFILKGILDRERDTFEQTLDDFYRLTEYPDCLQERFNLTIGKEPLYYYAGFFLNTMGGRLYLFRRDSMSRMVVSFYAIQIIDQANREGRNKYGIDISGSVDSLIEQIESSSIELQMRDYYLDALYEMKEKYQ